MKSHGIDQQNLPSVPIVTLLTMIKCDFWHISIIMSCRYTLSAKHHVLFICHQKARLTQLN
jgi:hypothetical protein